MLSELPGLLKQFKSFEHREYYLTALAALAQTASTAGELAEAREAAVRVIGMADVLKDEPPTELASLFLIAGIVLMLPVRSPGQEG